MSKIIIKSLFFNITGHWLFKGLRMFLLELKRLILLSVLNIFFITQVTSQITEKQAKSMLFERISIVSEYEGIFEIETAEIRVNPCDEEKTVVINDRIAIININNQLKVFSLTSKEEIGVITLTHGDGWDGNLISTGFSKYPNLKLTGAQWFADIPYKEEIHYFAHDQVKNAISQINNYCNVPNRNQYPEWQRNTTVRYRLIKTFPNKLEPPPTTVSSGSGVIVSKQGHIITNKHVILKNNYVFESYPGRWVIEDSQLNYKLRLFLADPRIEQDYSKISTSIKASIGGVEYDLAPVQCIGASTNTLLTIPEDLVILKVLYPPPNLKYAILDNNTNHLGEEVYTLGFPLSRALGGRMIYSNGYFSSETDEFDIYNMSINPGNSGGGIFDKLTGNLVGITTARIDDNRIGIKTEGICFGTRLNTIVEMVKSPNTIFINLNKYSDKSETSFFWLNPGVTSSYGKALFSMLVRDSKFNPLINLDNNSEATVQIIAR